MRLHRLIRLNFNLPTHTSISFQFNLFQSHFLEAFHVRLRQSKFLPRTNASQSTTTCHTKSGKGLANWGATNAHTSRRNRGHHGVSRLREQSW
jgi:hypothetical protein